MELEQRIRECKALTPEQRQKWLTLLPEMNEEERAELAKHLDKDEEMAAKLAHDNEMILVALKDGLGQMTIQASTTAKRKVMKNLEVKIAELEATELNLDS